MKRMSDVFMLPVIASLMDHEHAGEITQSGESHYCLEDSRYWMASDAEHIEAAAHAINHVDALADALEALTSDYASYRAINGIDLTDDHNSKLDVKMNSAIAALAAYRGENATPQP